MKLFRIAFAALIASITFASHAADGLIAVKSPHSAADTATRLVAALCVGAGGPEADK